MTYHIVNQKFLKIIKQYLFATSASSLFANDTNPKPFDPRSLKIISTSFTFPNFSNIALKSGSRNRKGIFDTCNRFDSVLFDSSEKNGSTIRNGKFVAIIKSNYWNFSYRI